jgi:fatty-acyl-CoA synthase
VIADLVAENAERTPDKTAVITASRTMSYSDLRDEGEHVAAGLAALGVRRGTHVGLLCTNRAEWLTVLLGANRLGATVAAFDTWSRAWDLEYLLANADVSVLVTLDEFRGRDYIADLRALVPELDRPRRDGWRSERFPRLRDVIVLGEDVPVAATPFAALLNEPLPSGAPGNDASAADVAFVLYTSGSTARAKGVPLVNFAAIENGFNIGERMRLTADDVVWVSVPLFWSYGSANALMATMTHGATIVLQEVFEPGEALDLIEEHRCTVAYTLPNITAKLIEHPTFTRERTASLRTGLTIGLEEDVRRAAEELGISGICNVYGSTETYGNCCVTPTDLPLETRMRSQGPPLPGMVVRVVDQETRAEATPGEAGEVLVGGYVSGRYLNNDELTRQSFSPDGFYRTGDLGYLDAEGLFHFVARTTEMIKTGGINVSPIEVERFLVAHPAVRGAAVVGRPDRELGQVVVAYIETAGGAEVTSDELADYCRGRLASYKVPREIVICAELPKTDTGKLDRRAVRAWLERAAEG